MTDRSPAPQALDWLLEASRDGANGKCLIDPVGLLDIDFLKLLGIGPMASDE